MVSTNFQAYGYAGNQAYPQMPNFAPAMANDFFGTQIFGNNVYNKPQQQTYTAPTNTASLILQNHINANSTAQTESNTPPTMEDYALATQIANMYSGANTPALLQNNHFISNDIFAQQVYPPFSMNNGQAIG